MLLLLQIHGLLKVILIFCCVTVLSSSEVIQQDRHVGSFAGVVTSCAKRYLQSRLT